MEVHHYSHVASGETPTSRKKWTHYFSEFLMLFPFGSSGVAQVQYSNNGFQAGQPYLVSTEIKN